MIPSARNCHGFTLIELSIVLVIIGLIIGGVLVGQDLVSAAATRAQIAQIEKYNSAVNTFQNKYNAIPGDMLTASAASFGFNTGVYSTGATGARDGNGLIDGGTAGTLQLAAIRGENFLFWQDLTSANLVASSIVINLTFTCTAGAITSTQLNAYIPPAAIGYGNFLHVYEANGFNWFMLAAIQGTTSGTPCTLTSGSNLPVTQAYNIDKKIDDEIPTSGSVQAVYITNSQNATTQAPNGNPDTASTCYNSSTNAYSTGVNKGSGPNCALSFKMQGAAR